MGWPTLNGDTSSGMSQSFKHRRKPMLAELQIPDVAATQWASTSPFHARGDRDEDEAESPKAPVAEAAQDVAVQVFLRVRAHPQAPASKVVTATLEAHMRRIKQLDDEGREIAAKHERKLEEEQAWRLDGFVDEARDWRDAQMRAQGRFPHLR